MLVELDGRMYKVSHGSNIRIAIGTPEKIGDDVIAYERPKKFSSVRFSFVARYLKSKEGDTFLVSDKTRTAWIWRNTHGKPEIHE